MAASKDEARPSSQHRMSAGHASSGLAHRNNSGRSHSHSVSLGTPNSAHRINRRKSSTSMNGVGMAALAAVAKDSSQDMRQAKVNSHMEGLGITTDDSVSSLPPTLMEADETSGFAVQSHSALLDGPSLSAMVNASKAGNKARTRRASEGSRIVKERTKSNAGELKCETCGKGYKHGSCLTKHLWEHTPEWALTSKLLISKHQQVQLLEAASVLVAIKQDGSPTLKPADQLDTSDRSSHSPGASASSDAIEEAEDRSSRTSTPSNDDAEFAKSGAFKRQPRRQDSYSSTYSRSYQSTSATSFGPSSGPNESGMFLYRGNVSGSRPSTASGLILTEEQADITAAAEGLLSCSLGTPQSGPVRYASDIPPVPPLPARFAKQYTGLPNLHSQYSTDVDMSDDDGRRGEEDEDEGVFGRMDQ